MITIVEGKQNIIRLLGKQVIKHSEYRLMKYVLQTLCQDGILLHNVITGQMVLLDGKESDILNELPSVYSESMNALIESRFLVPVEYDEKKTVDKLRLLIGKVLLPKGINNYVIFTTTDCNARCFYCFEHGCKRMTMDAHTGEKLVEYMISHKGDGPLRLRWFGGEPLIGLQRIDQICEMLNEREIKYVSAMVSNGYLFTDEIINKAVSLWHLNEVQITLDGTENIYNAVKSYVGVHGSPYLRVINNIESLMKHGIRVNIRLNLDMHNKDNLYDLAEEISRRFVDKTLLNVYVYVVEKDVGSAPIERTSEDDEGLYQQQERLSKRLDTLGLTRNTNYLPSIKNNRCMADNDGTVAIYPNGKLYKCERIVENEWVGDISTDSINGQMIALYKEKLQCKICDDCVLYPNCILLKKCPATGEYNDFTCEMRRKSYDEVMKRSYEAFLKQKRNP